MATTFSSAKVALDEIANRIQSNRQRLAQCQSLASQAESDLTTLGTQYAGVVTDINSAAQAAPSDVALANLKAESDKLVSEYNALKSKATDFKTATSGIAF